LHSPAPTTWALAAATTIQEVQEGIT